MNQNHVWAELETFLTFLLCNFNKSVNTDVLLAIRDTADLGT